MKRFRLNGFGHLFIKAGSLPFLLVFSVFSFLCCFVACGVWELTLDLFGKTQNRQPFGLAHGLSLRLSPNSDAGSRPQRPVALAFGELLPQPLCGRKRRAARSDASLEHDRMACDRRGNVVTKP